MALSIPTPESIYNGNYASLPSNTLKPPIEGNRTVPVNISWLRDGLTPRYTIHFNARSQQTLSISQISALHVDNSNNSSSMHVAFADTQFEVLVGPNQTGFYPVVTNSLEFWAWIDKTPLAQDTTIIQVLNFLPPPILFDSQPGGSGVGTVREIDTVAPLQGGPITDIGTVSLSTPLTINFGGTAGTTGATALDNLSGASGATTGPLTRAAGGTWSVAAGLSAPISVANGGTGRTTLTANAVLVGNGTAAVTQSAITSDNGTTLSVSTNLVIGTPAPAVVGPQQILVNSAANPPQAAPGAVAPELWLVDEGAAISTEIFLDNYGTGANQIVLRKARGTAAAPAVIQSGDILFNLNCYGRGATGYSPTGRANITINALENWTDTAQGTGIGIGTTAIGAAAQTNRMAIQQGVVIGNPASDPGQGSLVLNANAAAPPVPPAGTQLDIVAVDNVTAPVLLDSFGANGVPTLALRRARGTAAAPTALQAGDPIGNIEVFGRGATGYSAAPRAYVQAQAAEGWTDTAQGTNLYFFGTVPGGTTLAALAVFSGFQGAQLLGTTTNDNAQLGWVGEYVVSTIASPGVALASAANVNIGSISLGPGDWDVEGTVAIAPTASVTATNCWVNNVSATPAANGISGMIFNNATYTFLNVESVGRRRFTLAATTTIYLGAAVTLSGGTCTGYGEIRARRVR